MPLESRRFRELYKREMRHGQLRANLKKATLQAVDKRAESFEGVDFSFLQEQARRIRHESISHLNQYLSRFDDMARKNGCTLFYAQSAKDAKDYVLETARRFGARTIVKSKSMVTEEIELVPFLVENGIETVETDLGEYIVQLAGEKPSHITAPAIHKSRNEIADIFHRKIGSELNSDPRFLTTVARKVLREKFLRAEVGISGANFLVAGTGDIVIVENEGNARLSTSAVKAHIVVTGIEKVIPEFSDLRILLRLLGRSSTGQKLTSYVSLIRGPKAPDEKDGPTEVHIVLLDNGRSGLLGTQFQEVLHCIKCGACLNVCPVYRSIGGPAYGSVYPGPIGSLITPLLFGRKDAYDLPFASSLCGNCTEVCPVGIDIHHHLLSLRNEMIRMKKPVLGRFVFRTFRKTMLRPKRYRLLGKIGRLFARTRLTRFVLKNWTRYRDFPKPPAASFRETYIKTHGFDER
jgi:L-lactate dehydrogenase complex protein LldF